MAEIKFRRDTSFRKQFFVPDSFAHPAKMDAQLLIWITEHYSKVGETILDPMAGSGTTTLACTLGRNCILVELELKYIRMMTGFDCDGKTKEHNPCGKKFSHKKHHFTGNWEQVKARPQLGSIMGDCQIIQGDARQLDGLVDKIVTSPPYAEGVGALPAKEEFYNHPTQKKVHRYSNTKSTGGNYGTNPSNIGNLPYGEIDKCIFSPPYGDIESRDRSKEDSFGRELSGKYPRRGDINISAGYQIDKIVTSPPYEETISKHAGGAKGLREGKFDGWLGKSQIAARTYSESESNIGNLKGDTYLEAMLQVYQQCYSVLKPQGLMILVTKNFIRNKQVVRLDTDTIKLCEQTGFIYLKRHYRKLPSQSFWRVIYHQKHPEVEQILNEDVLVFEKE